jgi:hypothetical protein
MALGAKLDEQTARGAHDRGGPGGRGPGGDRPPQ